MKPNLQHFDLTDNTHNTYLAKLAGCITEQSECWLTKTILIPGAGRTLMTLYAPKGVDALYSETGRQRLYRPIFSFSWGNISSNL